MRALFLLALVSLTAAADNYPGRFERFCDRSASGRTTRGLLCDDLAFFEFAPASGAGMPAACSTTAPTGAKGEALTLTRASVATCTPTATGGLTTTGISTQSLVEVTNNVARVEYDSAGVLGLLVESSRAQVLFRFIDYANALWSDIGTPTLTGSQTSPFSGTYATSAVQFDDNDAVAYEGRQQTVTVSAGVAHTMHCYVRAGTATTARITLDGTAATITGLSSSTWSIVEVTDASSSGVAIVAQVMVGDATSTTGTVTFGGCQVEAGSYRTSIMPSVAAGVTRVAEGALLSATIATATATAGSVAATVTTPTGFTDGSAINYGSNGRPLYFFSSTVRLFDGTNVTSRALGASPRRYASSWSGSTATVFDITGGASTTGVFDGAMTITDLYIGREPTLGTYLDGIISRICIDPSDTRCR